MPDEGKPIVGLVLTGGGARASYQAGALKYIAGLYPDKCPYTVFTGVSAGGINVVSLAAGARFHAQTADKLWTLWSGLRHDMIFKADARSLLSIAARFLLDLSLGGNLFPAKSNFLLDAAPLRELLDREIYFSALRLNIRSGLVRGVALSATNYLTGTNITFYDTWDKAQDWVRSQRVSKCTHLTLDHLMATTAIPVFFPPVMLDGSYFGDGSVRLTSPLSAAIHLGADRILAIGIRHPLRTQNLLEMNRMKMDKIVMADIAGLLMNSIFMDSLDSDIERLERINRSLSKMAEDARKTHPDQLRPLRLLSINPSDDLGAMAEEQFDRFPPLLQHMLKGIGATRESGSELLSYLAFDGSYTTRLLELGYKDAKSQHDKIREFFET